MLISPVHMGVYIRTRLLLLTLLLIFSIFIATVVVVVVFVIWTNYTLVKPI